jgi:hypothetical protein
MNAEHTLPATCERTVTLLSEALTSHGYRVERSFDLRSALDNHDDCPCPHHGTIHCTCQYIILLVYETATLAPPVLVTAHGCDGITRLHVEASQPGAWISPRLATALDEAVNAMPVDV